MAQRRIKAAYHSTGPHREMVTYTKCTIDKETKSLQQEEVTEEKEVYHVRFPGGHSIRVGKKELVRLGFHIKPRMIDLDTGDVVDVGGDPYDFGDDPYRDENIALIEEEEKGKGKTKRPGDAATL